MVLWDMNLLKKLIILNKFNISLLLSGEREGVKKAKIFGRPSTEPIW